MKILIVHNHYGRYAPGGDTNVMEAEAKLLSEHGHIVSKYERTNAEIYEDGTLAEKIAAFRNIAWSKKSYAETRKIIQDIRPDIMHVHNNWLVLSPSIFAAAKDCGVATVFTLHNYRLICPGNHLLRNGRICEACLHGNPWRVLLNQCIPGGSLLKSFLSLVIYRETKRRHFLDAWVNAYIALSAFGRSKFIEAGLNKDKIFVKPNFIKDPINGAQIKQDTTGGALFAGRLSPEKGIETLIKAWSGVGYPLFIAGDGPAREHMQKLAPPSVTFLGWQSREDVLKLLQKVTCFIFPSDLYEGFGLSLLEAMASGKAIIASDLGPRREIIEDRISGLFFKAGDAVDLRAKIDLLMGDTALTHSLGSMARKTYLARYTPENNYLILMNIYKEALKRSKIHQ